MTEEERKAIIAAVREREKERKALRKRAWYHSTYQALDVNSSTPNKTHLVRLKVNK